MYVRAGRPAFDWPYAGVHRITSLKSSSLLLQQCPACLVRLAWIVFVIGGWWPYSWCLVGWTKFSERSVALCETLQAAWSLCLRLCLLCQEITALAISLSSSSSSSSSHAVSMYFLGSVSPHVSIGYRSLEVLDGIQSSQSWWIMFMLVGQEGVLGVVQGCSIGDHGMSHGEWEARKNSPKNRSTVHVNWCWTEEAHRFTLNSVIRILLIYKGGVYCGNK